MAMFSLNLSISACLLLDSSDIRVLCTQIFELQTVSIFYLGGLGLGDTLAIALQMDRWMDGSVQSCLKRESVIPEIKK